MNSIIQYQQKIEQYLDEFSLTGLNSNPKELYDPIKYILTLGGKRTRPLLVLLGCELFSDNVDCALPAAAGIELFHNFSLIHDDIMDNAPLRRTQPTVHEKWNRNIAILSGDAMLVKAYQQFDKLPNEYVKKCIDVFSATALKVCEGQQLDMNYETAHKISINQYLWMIEHKTAVLLGASLQIGAIVGGASDEEAQKLYEFGKYLGVAFQIQDDILDVYGNEQKFGKQKGGDIISNKKTYLLIKAQEISKINHYKEEELLMWLQAGEEHAKQKVEAVTAIYDSLEVRKIAEEEMHRQYIKAITYMQSLAVEPQKKQTLLKFAEGLMNRDI
ncbi:MAG: polyprenyl synthetase family protein [Bacteroidetes bacterium]|nr:polyprenyl synthetase family protein [Bacteroidota bacterium]